MRCLRFFLLAVFICFIGNVQAQSGCIKYYGPGFDAVPVYYPTDLGTAGVWGNNYGGSPLNLPAGCSPTEPASSLTRECTIGGIYGGLLLQNHIQCPIDDYLPLLFLSAGCIAVISIRNRSLFAISKIA